MKRILSLFVLLGVAFWFAPGDAAPPEPAKDAFKDKLQPFVATYCLSCHSSEKMSGGLALDVFQGEAHVRKNRKIWDEVQKMVTAGEMPPKDRGAKKFPKADEKQAFLETLGTVLKGADCTAQKDPGRVTLRRLNRAEFDNTIRDLVGVKFKPAEDFPSDDVGYGFDNIGDVLSMQPLMIEKYLAAADKILDAALPDGPPIKSINQVYKPQQILVEPKSAKTRMEDEKKRNVDRIAFKEKGRAFIEKFYFPVDGDYTVRIRAWSSAPDNDKVLPQVLLRVGNQDLKTFDIDRDAATYEVKTVVRQGERRVEANFLNPSKDSSRVLHVGTLEVEGPLNAETAVPDSMKRILTKLPGKADDKSKFARSILSDFARRAFRRPVKDDEIDRLMKLYQASEKRGDRFDQALKLPLKAVLVSPHFLFRIEEDPKKLEEIRTIGEHELATRLSYFLWSSMPDEELSRLADKGELRKPGVLESQVKRMLKDPKAAALTENFAGQWLMLRNLATHTPDTRSFPKWGDNIRQAMIRETEMFFGHIVENDRSVLEFVDCDYTFVNQPLAMLYGIPKVEGAEFRKVTLPDRRRGGLITQGSMLTVTSNPTRTSPVKRGKWIYENILGLAAPLPPPDVPELKETGELKGTLRQQMEQHRANPNCAVCHNKLDPLGFGLENFDGIGAWREADNKVKIDAGGVLPDGAKFDGPAGLRKVLLAKSDLFRRCLAEKLTTYALGRGLEHYDKCVLDDLTAKLARNGDRFSALVLGIVESDPFQKRRGKRSE